MTTPEELAEPADEQLPDPPPPPSGYPYLSGDLIVRLWRYK